MNPLQTPRNQAKPPRLAHLLPTDTCQTNASLPTDLCKVVAAWPTLPEALRAGITAMVAAAGKVDG